MASEELVYEDRPAEYKSLRAIEFSPDGLHIVFIYFCGIIKRLDTATWETVAEWKMPFCVRHFSAIVNGKNAIAGLSGRLWSGDIERQDSAEFGSYRKSRGVIGVGLRKKGNELVTGSKHGVFRIWNFNLGRKSMRPAVEIEESEAFVDCLSLSADGKRVSSLSRIAIHYLWDAPTGREIAVFGDMDLGTCFALSQDGKKLASSSHEEYGRYIVLGNTDEAWGIDFLFESNLSFSAFWDGRIVKSLLCAFSSSLFQS